MKEFACGDVVTGCMATFTGETDDEILSQVATHAREAHGIESPPPELVEQVQTKIRVAA